MIKVILWVISIIAILFVLLRFFVIPSQSKLPENIKAPAIANTSEQQNHTASHLSDCPDKPNCVSSQATKSSQKIEPFQFEGSAKDAIDKLVTIANDLPRSQILNQQANYLHVVFKSPMMGFVDDTEFLADETSGIVQVRSAARLGHSDLEKNRQRIELFREAYE